MKLFEITFFDATIVEHIMAIGSVLIFFFLLESYVFAISLYLFGDYEGSIRERWERGEDENEEEFEAGLQKEVEYHRSSPWWFKLAVLVFHAISLFICFAIMYFFVMIWGGFPALEVIVLSIVSFGGFVTGTSRAFSNTVTRWWKRLHTDRRDNREPLE